MVQVGDHVIVDVIFEDLEELATAGTVLKVERFNRFDNTLVVELTGLGATVRCWEDEVR